MMHTRWIAMLVAAAVLVGCQTSATEDAPPPRLDAEKANPGPNAAANPGNVGGKTPPGGGEEPLRLDSAEATALLGADDGPPPSTASAEGKATSNFRCLVCHGNFSGEELAVSHAANTVGCEHCHGPCDEHCSDENNITPPTRMFARDQIDPSCTVCHDSTKVTEAKLWCIREPKPSDADKRCTDCHGKHRNAVRDVRWNKKTGELLKGGWMGENKK